MKTKYNKQEIKSEAYPTDFEYYRELTKSMKIYNKMGAVKAVAIMRFILLFIYLFFIQFVVNLFLLTLIYSLTCSNDRLRCLMNYS